MGVDCDNTFFSVNSNKIVFQTVGNAAFLFSAGLRVDAALPVSGQFPFTNLN